MHWDSIYVYILYTLSLSIDLYYLLIVKRNYFSNNYIIITKGVPCYGHRYSLRIRTHLGAGAHGVVHWGKCAKMVYSIMLPLMTLTLLSEVL